MDEAIKKLLKAIGEDPDSPQASTVELLQDLFATATKSADGDPVSVEKAKGGFGKLMEALGDNEEAKALCQKMAEEYAAKDKRYAEMEEQLEGMKPKEKQKEDDEKEEEYGKKKKDLAPIVLSLADRILAQDGVMEKQLEVIKSLTERVTAVEQVLPALVEEVKAYGSDNAMQRAIASLAARLPKEATRAARPTEQATPIDVAALTAQLAGMEKALGTKTGPAHPLAGMTAGPGVAEGGV